VATALVRLLAERGDRLHLVGRNEAKLQTIAASLSEVAPGRITTQQADFARLDSCAAVIEVALQTLGAAELVLIAHGDLGDQLCSETAWDEAERLLTANLSSAVALIIPIANHLEQRRAGQLAVITSVAGERGRPRNYTYGAAKGALGIYLQGVRSRLHPCGVTVTELRLGPVDTPMTADHPKNALFVGPDVAARALLRAIDARRAVARVPWFWNLIMPVVRVLPEWLFQRFGFLSGR